MQYGENLKIAKNSLEASDEDVAKRNVTTTPMSDDQIATFEDALRKIACSGRSFFFGLCAKGLMEQVAADDELDWPPRFLTKKEALFVKEILPLFTKKEMLLLKKMFLSNLEEKPAKKRPRKKDG